MLGAIAGDIIGSLHEGAASRGRHFTLFNPRSSFTDDSVLTIAVAHAVRLGLPYDTAGPYGSFGNGSAMRVSPIAWAFDTLEEVIRSAELSAAVTHNHPERVRGAAAIAAAIYLARTGTDKGALATCIQERFNYDCRISLQELEQRGGFDTSCQATVTAALGAFMHSSDFEDAVRIAVSLGGDTDTLACIARSIAEAHYGIPEVIQQEALCRLDQPLREELQLFAERFQLVHLAGAFPALHPTRQVESPANGVLVEATSVIVRLDSVYRNMEGGLRAFLSMVPNQTFCADLELARVGFMAESEARDFAAKLEQRGLQFMSGGRSVDIAIANPFSGLLESCDWLILTRVQLTATGSLVTAACLRGSKIERVAVPKGWQYLNSLSQSTYIQFFPDKTKPEPRWVHVRGGPV